MQNGKVECYNTTAEDDKTKEELISRNYKDIYFNLLPDEGQYLDLKRPINVGNKDVYALSDIEGYNIDFLDFLKKLGLVEYQEQKPSPFDGWESCLSLKKNQFVEFPVYYKFNEEACRNFNDVIVLCGDYVRNSRGASEGVVQILEELNDKLNNGRKEEHKRLYLIAGNHDIYDFFEEERSQHDLKRRILNLGLYPQLLLVNGDDEKLLFQHTNFPYREERNYIVNKKIDPNKAIELLNDDNACNKPILLGDGFFNLRYIMPEGAQQPRYQNICGMQELKREVYSDFGIGYDAKFVGHDCAFKGISYRHDQGGNVYNVNLGNQNEQNFVKWPCVNKELSKFTNLVVAFYDYYKNNVKFTNKNIDDKEKKQVLIDLAVINALKVMSNNINH